MPSRGEKSYYDEITTKPKSSVLDAFGRLKVSNQNVQLSAKQIHDDLIPLYFDTAEVSGAGTNHTHDIDNACSILSVTAGTAGHRVRQSKQRFNYQSGKSQNIAMTFNFRGVDAGVIKRVGYFDEDNGIFLQLDNDTVGNFSFGIRKNGVDRLIPIPDWAYSWGFPPQNILFSSRGLTLNSNTTKIFIADFEWLGSGTIRFGFQINGAPVWVHSEHHANIADTVYMQTPNLPIRYEIISDGSNPVSTMDAICATVASDGGLDLVGKTVSIDRGISGFATGNSTDIFPVLSFRLRSNYRGSVLIPVSFSITHIGNASFRFGILKNPTIAGIDSGANPVNWVAVDGTGIEYNTTRDNTNILSDGFQIISGYSIGKDTQLFGDALSIIRPGIFINGIMDEFIMFVQNTTGSDTYFGSLIIRELT